MPDKRLSPDEREMYGSMHTHEMQHVVDQRIAAKVSKLPQRHASAEVPIVVGVAARAVKRAVACDLDGKHGGPALKDVAPGGKESTRVHKGRAYATFVPRSVLVGESVPLVGGQADRFR